MIHILNGRLGHDGVDDPFHQGTVTLHVRVDWYEIATNKLLVLGRVALVGLSVLLGHLPSDALDLAIRAFEAQLFG